MTPSGSAYPTEDRAAWITGLRPPRGPEPDPNLPQAVFRELEPSATGEVIDSGVVLLTNRECPWRCVMCDLWQHTTREAVPLGAIPRQVARAVATWRQGGVLPTQVKLYNSGSFFDPAAIPPDDYAPVAWHLGFARHVIVESHPLLVGERTMEFRGLVEGTLEVAMGLETAEPDVLEKLNKRFTLAQFARAAAQLVAEQIAVRAFVLVNPPFLPGRAGVEWAVRSAAFAFECGATAVTLIATRGGNGTMEQLRASGDFVPPTLADLEQAQREALALARGRVFADTWNLELFATCPDCFAARKQRLEAANRTQRDQPTVRCARCHPE